MATHPSVLVWRIQVHRVSKSQTGLSAFTFTFRTNDPNIEVSPTRTILIYLNSFSWTELIDSLLDTWPKQTNRVFIHDFQMKLSGQKRPSSEPSTAFYLLCRLEEST